MQRNSLYIVYAGLGLGCTSIFYFLCLALGLPFIFSVLLVIAAGAGLWWLSLRHLPVAAQGLDKKDQGIVFGAMVFGISACIFLARKYGDWDAVYIYNLAARFLQDPVHWKQLFRYRDQFSHADYPLHLPALVAFFQRISGNGYKEWVPFIIALFYTVSIPLLLFSETVRQHRMLAIVAVVAIMGNTYYLNNGMIQCADVPLSFYLLLAFISMHHYRQDQDASIWIVVYGMALGLCAWTKNEGLLYAVIMMVFHFKELRRHIKCLAWGFLPVLAVWLLFKCVFAPPNDMVSGFRPGDIVVRLAAKERYKMIAAAYGRYISEYFQLSRLAAMVYLFLCIYRQRLPHRDFFVFLAFGLAMTGVYLFSYHDLGWHLENSLSRILLQWYPSFWFVVTVQLAGLLPQKEQSAQVVDK